MKFKKPRRHHDEVGEHVVVAEEPPHALKRIGYLEGASPRTRLSY
jgi:hypothetical protein